MEISESFTVPAAVETVWAFFQDVERVSRCVPGLESVTVLGPDRYCVVASQKVGFFSATFELTTQLEAQEPLQFMQYSSVGRSIKGAVGNIRSRDRVEFLAAEGGATEVRIHCEPAMGGMLGTVGHKVVVAKFRELTGKFAQALARSLRDGAGPAEVPPSAE